METRWEGTVLSDGGWDHDGSIDLSGTDLQCGATVTLFKSATLPIPLAPGEERDNMM